MKLNTLFRLKRKPTKVQKILFVTLSNLGDVVLTLPVLQSLRESYPQASIDVIVGPGGQMVFDHDERIRKVTIYQKKSGWREKARELFRIRSEKYDLAVDLRRSLFGLLSGARYRNSYLLRLPKKRMHRALRHLMALRGLTKIHHTQSFLAHKSKPPVLPEFKFLETYPKIGERLIVAAPGSKSDLKKWPAASYARLLDRLAIQDQARIVLIGDITDVADAAHIQSLMTTETINLCGKTDFNSLLRVLEKAELVITNDSAPLHLADSLRRPVLAIFGPTDSRKYGPRYRHAQVAKRTLFCAPCEQAQCRFSHECMKELGVDEVYAKALSILNDTNEQKNIRILISRLDRIGDVVLSLPAIEAIRRRFPNAFISVMTRPSTAPLVEGNPSIDEVIPYFYEKKGRHSGVWGSWRFIREIAKRDFDIAFILHPSHRSYLVPFFAGIPYRVGFKTRIPKLLTHSTEDLRFEGLKHESEYTMDVVRAFGIEEPDKIRPKIYFSEEHRRRTEELLHGCTGTMIAIHAGASCPSKRWPKERFAEAALSILEKQPEAFFVLVGGEEEQEIGEFLAQKIGGRAMNLTAQLNLKELAAVLSRAQLLISNDSGPVHMAAAVGTPTLTIFGRSLPGLSTTRWRALGDHHAAIRKEVGCVICLAHRCTIDFECLRVVSSEEVAQKTLQMLSKQTQTA